MRIGSIQPEALYEKLKTEKVLHCDPARSELVSEYDFGPAYGWLAQQMAMRVAPPPEGVLDPFWAWHTIGWEHRQPDLRRTEFRSYKDNRVCLELEIPDNMVLLSDEELWHCVWNDWYCGDDSHVQEREREDAWFDRLPSDEQAAVKRKSWEKIFNVFPPYKSPSECRGQYVQATFWELRLDQVVAVRRLKGRFKNKTASET